MVTITTTPLEQGPFRLSVTVSADHPRSSLAVDVERAVAGSPATLDGQHQVQVWVEEVRDGDDELLASVATPYRDLLQLRRNLPAPPSGIETRAFDPRRDIDAFIEVNNRAFSWHPEQAGMTRDRFVDIMGEAWFDPEGFRILELDGRIAGFCWTKVHDDHSPVLGEIYVIGLDPDYHGRGLGGPMTLAGLEWLASRHVTVANLYVESDNEPALRTYDRLGFVRHSTNRAYRTDPE